MARAKELSDSRLRRGARNAKGKILVIWSHHPMKTRSAKRARDEDRTQSNKRLHLADSEDKLTTHGPSSDNEDSERAEPAAGMRKRPHSQSQAAVDPETVPKKATAALQQISNYCFLLAKLLQSMHISPLSFAPRLGLQLSSK